MDVIETAQLIREPLFARRPITVDEYYRMTEVGILRPDERIELIEGELVAMPAMGSPHLSAVLMLNRLFSALVGEMAIVLVQASIRLNDRTMPEPDVALLRMRPDNYRLGIPGPEDVLLLIEVADSSLEYDLGVKKPLYARNGIPEYWVVDVNARSVHVCCKPEGEEYQSADQFVMGSQLQPSCLPGTFIQVARIFT